MAALGQCLSVIHPLCYFQSTTGGTYWTHKDEIYIDDEGIEGSGGTSDREIKSDLESSGSGFGPDDEDGDGSGVDCEYSSCL